MDKEQIRQRIMKIEPLIRINNEVVSTTERIDINALCELLAEIFSLTNKK